MSLVQRWTLLCSLNPGWVWEAQSQVATSTLFNSCVACVHVWHEIQIFPEMDPFGSVWIRLEKHGDGQLPIVNTGFLKTLGVPLKIIHFRLGVSNKYTDHMEAPPMAMETPRHRGFEASCFHGSFLTWWYPKIDVFFLGRIPLKGMIRAYPYFRKPPYIYIYCINL